MLNPLHLRTNVVQAVLIEMDMHTPAAEDLVMGTAAQESNLIHLTQIDGGPALGLWQMEPATHDDIWDNYLRYRDAPIQRQEAATMIGNLYYACAMCRLHYYRRPEALPKYGDIEGYAAYWKQHYNTPLGHGTEEEFILNFQRVQT